MTWLDVAREYFPDASDDDLGYILWNHTGFPTFWHYDEAVETQLRRQLQHFKDNPDHDPDSDV